MTSDKAYAVEARLDTYMATDTGWSDFGSLSNSWSKSGGAGSCRYRRLRSGMVVCEFQFISVGTTANGTTVISSANSFPSDFYPGQTLWLPLRTDNEGGQQASFMVSNGDGHFECWGIGSTATRVDGVLQFMGSGL